MALTPGSRLGPYEVTALLGEGGMGQVWRATDTTLGRQVAIKILPDAFAADPERLARFEREAKTLASLNHPHIAAIYGFEKTRKHQQGLGMTEPPLSDAGLPNAGPFFAACCRGSWAGATATAATIMASVIRAHLVAVDVALWSPGVLIDN